MSELSQKTEQEMSDKDRQFEKLLSSAFQLLAARCPHVPILGPESKVSRNATSSPGVLIWK